MDCTGDGRCLTECNCVYLKRTKDCHCFDYTHEHLKGSNVRFCKTDKPCNFNCHLKKCETFNYCGKSYPEWYYIYGLTTGDQCNGCGIYKVKFINEKENCLICSEDKYIIETDCNHRFCLDCLQNMNGYENENLDSPCPFCKRSIEHNELTIGKV